MVSAAIILSPYGETDIHFPNYRFGPSLAEMKQQITKLSLKITLRFTVPYTGLR